MFAEGYIFFSAAGTFPENDGRTRQRYKTSENLSNYKYMYNKTIKKFT